MRGSLRKICILLVAAFVFNCGNVCAQHVGFIFGHALYAGPLDKNFSNNYNSGLGVEAGGGIGWNKTFIVGTLGYSNFFTKYGNETGDLKYIPLKAGLRQYIFLKTIYLHGDLGVANIKNSEGSQSRFSGDIGAGIKFMHFEVQVDYDGFSRNQPSGYASWFALKAGFEFGL